VCQQARKQWLLLESWLRTGAATPGTAANHYIRRYLDDLQGSQCDLCGLQAEWEGKPLRFVLDHVDGDSTNNHRGNLRLVCPNCDSQLPTYKSRQPGARSARPAAPVRRREVLLIVRAGPRRAWDAA
jgi:hypothetical protein